MGLCLFKDMKYAQWSNDTDSLLWTYGIPELSESHWSQLFASAINRSRKERLGQDSTVVLLLQKGVNKRKGGNLTVHSKQLSMMITLL